MSRQSDMDNHAYWESRCYDDRPDDWEDRQEEEHSSYGDRQAEAADTESNTKR